MGTIPHSKNLSLTLGRQNLQVDIRSFLGYEVSLGESTLLASLAEDLGLVASTPLTEVQHHL